MNLNLSVFWTLVVLGVGVLGLTVIVGVVVVLSGVMEF
ncbi:hypothetical protein FHU40_003385 [Nocardioides soli]|uniref:Uncharacterized protein n=1 Tax=Nocardioides soli TaxID=1036020 RepID=A0A7W4VXG3_9ACTN|nr:hypothetical protein [Nocardioides soli]